MATKVETAESIADYFCRIGRTDPRMAREDQIGLITAAIESRDRAIIGDVLGRVMEKLGDRWTTTARSRVEALRRELTGEGRGEVAPVNPSACPFFQGGFHLWRRYPDPSVTNDIEWYCACGATKSKEPAKMNPAKPDDRTWFSPSGLEEHDREVAKKVLRYAVAFWLDHPKIKHNAMTTPKWIRENTELYWNPIAEHFGLTPADLAPAKVEYTPSDIKVVDVRGVGIVIECGNKTWDGNEWTDQAIENYSVHDAEAIARALREAKMMPKGGGK